MIVFLVFLVCFFVRFVLPVSIVLCSFAQFIIRSFLCPAGLYRFGFKKKKNSCDTPFILSFAIIMLNTDLHRANAGTGKRRRRRMSKEDFISNLRCDRARISMPYRLVIPLRCYQYDCRYRGKWPRFYRAICSLRKPCKGCIEVLLGTSCQYRER